MLSCNQLNFPIWFLKINRFTKKQMTKFLCTVRHEKPNGAYKIGVAELHTQSLLPTICQSQGIPWITQPFQRPALLTNHQRRLYRRHILTLVTGLTTPLEPYLIMPQLLSYPLITSSVRPCPTVILPPRLYPAPGYQENTTKL